MEEGVCSLYEEYYYNIINTGNLLRIIFYTPIIFVGSVVGSIIYDYYTLKEDTLKENTSNKLH